MEEKEEILEAIKNLENTGSEICEEIEEVVEEIDSEEYDEVEDAEFEEYYESKKPLGKLITLVAFTAIMLISSTYAWFSAQKTVRIGNLEGKVNVAEGLEISLDAEHWSQEINFEDYDTSATGIAVYGTRVDGTSLAQQYGSVVHNQLPSELIPVSTTATGATYESDGETIKTAANGIGLTDVAFYMGEMKTTGTQSDTITSLHNIIQADEDIESAATDGYAGYFAIDLFLRNSSRLDSGETQGEAKETLQLNTNSMLELVSGGATATGLQNTVRVALALYEPDLTVTGAGVGITDNQDKIIKATTGSTVKIEDVAIWEPNADQHVDYIVTNNNLIYWDTAQEDLYLDAFGTYNATTGAYETKGTVTGRSRFTGTDRIPTYGLTKEAVTAGTIASIYKWDGTAVGLEKQVTLQTKKSEDDFSITDGGIRNLVSIKSPKTIIYDQGNEEDVVEFQIYKNQVSRLRMYVWLEGQDVDCINYASHGSGIHLDLGLMKSAVPGSAGDEAGGGDSGVAELPSTTETTPYLPSVFSYDGTTDLSNGLTVKDTAQNEYVWVEVPKSLYNNTAYNTKTTTADMKPASSTDYDKIEYCLQKYTATYRNGTSYTDTWISQDATGLTETAYYEYKEKMLKSVYENGGFYVGKYETGIADSQPDEIDETVEARTAKTQAIEDYTPVIQANAYPYNFVTCAQAQDLASGMAPSGYTSSLLFGVQWDLVLKYMETNATNQDTIVAQLNSDSTSWGNYKNNTTYNITNTSAKYAKETDSYVWVDGAYGQKASETSVLLSTGASSDFSKMGIYDIAGNVYEWTLEYTSDSGFPCAFRGGIFSNGGSIYPASSRLYSSTTGAYRGYGFRVSLY